MDPITALCHDLLETGEPSLAWADSSVAIPRT
jgi:hypothetical protein